MRMRPELAAAFANIHLDLAAVNAEGLTRTVEVMRGSRGRVGCRADEFLCVGNTHQPDYRTVLSRLASLDYVTRIEPCYGE